MKSLLLIITLLLTLLHSKEVSVEKLFNVKTVKVKLNSHAKKMKSFGFVKADQSRIYDVSPRFSGFVENLYADKIYKKVTKGQALVKVYSPEVLKAKDEYINSVKYSKNKSMINSSMTKLKLLNVPNTEIKSVSKNRTFTTIVSPANGYIFKKSINNNSDFAAKKVIFESCKFR